ncbi:hypothetical protein V5F34_01240 [Xanthobacter autotrophicus]|uniref:DUF3313 domain-containing protein n=1 Tax=Xanthobacter autotrophicus TaxID=280 RepID=A0A6C1K8Q5_XANAU|nr:hypothetical protein [Xanthobacter autotrophicus]TLX40669.1 hypothetical protein FBQ73_21705 [Xanthobacter autotrophicus]
MRLQFLIWPILLVTLAACASLPAPSISLADLGQFRLAGVEVKGAQAFGSWPAEEEAYLAAHALDQDTINRIKTRPIREEPAMATFALARASHLMQQEMTSATASIFTGQKPVKMVVDLRRFDVPSVARRIFTDQVATLSGRVLLVDQHGVTLLDSPDLNVAIPLLGGLSTPVASAVEASSGNDPGAGLVRKFAEAYRGWLLQK